MALCGDMDRLESEADHVMRAAIARLFREEPDVRELIKLRSVYEHLETVTDRCEDVANIIQGIAVGLQSVFIPVLFVVAGIVTSYILGERKNHSRKFR